MGIQHKSDTNMRTTQQVTGRNFGLGLKMFKITSLSES
jgi:hypothetical protein